MRNVLARTAVFGARYVACLVPRVGGVGQLRHWANAVFAALHEIEVEVDSQTYANRSEEKINGPLEGQNG
jgi:hypothetical protein